MATGRAVVNTAGAFGSRMAQLPSKTLQAGKSMLFDSTEVQQPMPPGRTSTVTPPVSQLTNKRIFRG